MSRFVPAIEWREALPPAALDGLRSPDFELLTTWPALPYETSPTHCYRRGADFLIHQSGIGAACCHTDRPVLTATPDACADEDRFKDIVRRSWLPAFCPIWGVQVIHASAVALARSGDAIAFTGFTQAGKSTTAYGVSRRPGWHLLADDTIAFDIDHAVHGPASVRLLRVPNETRLRPASAQHFGVDRTSNPISWPDTPVRLRAIYALEGRDQPGQPEFTRLHVGDALPLLMAQAYALSLEIPKYNQQLMIDYTRLASVIPVFKLTYFRSFDVADALYAAIDTHVAGHVLV